MRFPADENVSSAVVSRLLPAGHELISVRETKPGAADRDVLAMAESEGSVLLTEDRDFGELVVRQRLAVRGVILIELDRLSNTVEAARVRSLQPMPTSSRATCL